jgi:DNA-dependent metalloprotease WSS1
MPVEEAQRLARRRAEEQYARTKNSGRTLGGRRPQAGSDMRQVIANAAGERVRVERGCPTERDDVQSLTDKYGHAGQRTAAEENDAENDEIMRALIDLLQNDEERKLNGLPPLGSSRDSPIPLDSPQRSGSSSRGRLNNTPSTPPHKSTSAPPVPRPTGRDGRPVSRLVMEAENRRPASISRQAINSRQATTYPPSASNPPPAMTPVSIIWSCPVCTLDNPAHITQCEACESIRPGYGSSSTTTQHTTGPRRLGSQREEIQSNGGGYRTQPQPQPQPQSQAAKQRSGVFGWTCHQCNSFMPHEWWTCSSCGQMKASS